MEAAGKFAPTVKKSSSLASLGMTSEGIQSRARARIKQQLERALHLVLQD